MRKRQASRFAPRNSENSLPITGRYARLGAHLYDDGVDVAVFAGFATAVEVCFVDVNSAMHSETRYRLHRDTWGKWVGHIRGIHAGQAYGYRVYGPWDPDSGKRHNPAKLLLDPYARGLVRTAELHPAIYGHVVDDHFNPQPGLEPDDRDSTPFAALGAVMEADTRTITHPNTPWNRTVIYEAHVVGLTKKLEGIPEELRGTYAGVAHPVTINHLRALGVTAIELLPIHAKMSEPFLTERGLSNYWGYSTLSFFAPEPTYAMQVHQDAGPKAVIDEVKGMIDLLHNAGIEVILDVVYNHTCEGGADGPSVSWRGLDNSTYYRHDSAQPGRLKDTTGTGNSMDFRRTNVVGLALDSLRYWVKEMGVDGFRFDLAVTMARRGDTFDPNHPLYVAMSTDPTLSSVKLINEPWDVGYGGWRTGQFPAPTADWNDRFRDTVRDFWICQPPAVHAGETVNDVRDLATRLSGSADLFSHGRLPGGRGVYSAINFITAHDGMTMFDLTSFNRKHNEANGEDNRDGSDNNRSWNHGTEGPADESTEARRRKTVRNLFATLAFSAGTPMITAGDEYLKTQHGNNNAYCQDSDLSYIDWTPTEERDALFDTVSYLFQLRREHAVLRPSAFFSGDAEHTDELSDLEWFNDRGEPIPDHQWFDPNTRTIQMMRSGRGKDVDAVVILNGQPRDVAVKLPAGRGVSYSLVWSSDWERPRNTERMLASSAVTFSPSVSMQLYFANPA